MQITQELTDLEDDPESFAADAAKAASETRRPPASLTPSFVKRGRAQASPERPPETEVVRPGPAFEAPSPVQEPAKQEAPVEAAPIEMPAPEAEIDDQVDAGFIEPEKPDQAMETAETSSKPGEDDPVRSIRRAQQASGQPEWTPPDETADSQFETNVVATTSRQPRINLAFLTWREVGFFSVLYVFALLLFGSLFDFWSVLGLN